MSASSTMSWLRLLLALSVCHGISAQVPWPTTPVDPGRQSERSQWGLDQGTNRSNPQLNSPLAPRSLQPQQLNFLDGIQGLEGFQGFQSVYPQYPGYPQYPAGFGVKPRIGGYLPSEPSEVDLEGVFLPPGLKIQTSSSGWPSWIDPSLPEGSLPPAAQRAVVARSADRVWVLTPDESAFTPLTFYAKFRMIESGSVVEVRNKGEFQLAFHDGALIRSRGPARIGIPRLADGLAELQIRAFRRLWLYAKSRPFKVLLPDGSMLELAQTEMYFEERGRRGFLHNHGPETVQWRGRTGNVELAPGRRIDILLDSPAREFLPAGLELAGSVRSERKGRVLELRGEGDGGVATWSGARFRVRGGAVVRIDPLAGSTFPEIGK